VGHSPKPAAAGAVVLLTVITSVLLSAFAWPSIRFASPWSNGLGVRVALDVAVCLAGGLRARGKVVVR
jgi:hypothetical protein